MPEDVLEPGWAMPTSDARKFHFFPLPERRSLCGRYGLILIPPGLPITPDDGGAKGPDDCAACYRKLEASRA